MGEFRTLDYVLIVVMFLLLAWLVTGIFFFPEAAVRIMRLFA